MSFNHKVGCFLLSILFLSWLAGCSTIQPDPPQVSLKSLEVVELSLSHALLQAELDMINPNSFDLNIASADYRLSLNGVKISSGKSDRGVNLPANGRGTLLIDLSSSYLDIFSLMQEIRPGEPLAYELAGTIELAGFGLINIPYPIHKTGTIDLEDMRN